MYIFFVLFLKSPWIFLLHSNHYHEQPTGTRFITWIILLCQHECRTQYVNYHCATFISFYLQLSIDHVNYIPKRSGKKNIFLNCGGLFDISLLRLTDLSENNVPKFLYYFDCMLCFGKEKGGSVVYLYLHRSFSFFNSISDIVPKT